MYMENDDSSVMFYIKILSNKSKCFVNLAGWRSDCTTVVYITNAQWTTGLSEINRRIEFMEHRDSDVQWL